MYKDDLQIFCLHFHLFEVVGLGGETQLQMSENFIIMRLRSHSEFSILQNFDLFAIALDSTTIFFITNKSE